MGTESKRKNAKLVTTILMLVAAAMHYTFANTFTNIQGSSEKPNQLISTIIYNYTVLINIIASFIVVTCVGSLVDIFLPPEKNRIWAQGRWWLLVITGGFSFAVGVIAINMYSKMTVALHNQHLVVDNLQENLKVGYYCALADGVVAFVIGLPSTMVLLHIQCEKKALRYFPVEEDKDGYERWLSGREILQGTGQRDALKKVPK